MVRSINARKAAATHAFESSGELSAVKLEAKELSTLMEEPSNACILLIDLPNAAFCGIDLLSFTSSPRFRGIKHLPPGWHFVFVGATNSFSLRNGAWFHIEASQKGPPEVVVKQWSKQNEELLPLTDEPELQRLRANLGAIWREGLTPYRQSATNADKDEEHVYEERGDWNRMTDCITAGLLSRVTGMTTRDHWALTSASSAEVDYDDIPGLSQAESVIHPENSLGFLPVDLKRTWAVGTVGRARTEAARDRSWALEQISTSHCQNIDEVVGEMQFCFIMVLTLNNNSCLEQWKRLLSLLLTCTQAVLEHPKLFVRFLECLKLQIEHCQDAEGGLFDMTDESGNLLQALLQKFRHGLESQTKSVSQDVWDELDEVEDVVRIQRGWQPNESQARRGMLELEDGEQVEMDTNRFDEEDETGEYAPMIVDLTSEQKQALGQEDEAMDILPTSVLTHRTKLFAVPDDKDEEEDDRDIEEMDPRY